MRSYDNYRRCKRTLSVEPVYFTYIAVSVFIIWLSD
jgi:hypothetical protein